MTARRVGTGTRLLLGASLLIAGCEDEDSASACGVAPCGGAVVGVWEITQLCNWDDLEEATANSNCAGMRIDTSGITLSGPVNLAADNTYSVTMVIGGNLRTTMPAECLTSDNGIQLTCAQLQMAVQTGLTEPDSPYESFTCTGSSSCTCTGRMRSQQIMESGTYVASGTTLTLTDSAGEVSSSNYCVNGTTLTLTAQDEASSSPSLVLVKQ